MSLFTDASLVMIPSGIKDQKVYSVTPTDGSGDLTFSRASNATRVNSSGLVEKVRENLILQSNSFDTTWVNDDSTETSGQAGYDGTNNAWLLTKTAANGRIGQVISVSGSATFSVYAKAGTDNWVLLGSSDANVLAYFNLASGSIGTAGAGTTAKISSAGNGWYRCSISGSSPFSYFNIWVADADNDTSGTSGNILIQASQLETGDIATDYIATTSAAVSVGPVSGLPRLDYSGGASCPSLLLEPQRSNLLTFSEQFDNAAWTKSNLTVTPNAAISPDGYQNADKIVGSVAIPDLRTASSVSITSGASYTWSAYVKNAGYKYVRLTAWTADDPVTIYDLDAISVVSETGPAHTSTIEDAGNGWRRITITRTSSNSIAWFRCIPLSDSTATSPQNGVDGIYLWGAQLEAGSYASSYIPTLSSAVTRVADAASKTGISSLIGQTEGTIFLDFVYNGIQNLYANLINSEKNTTNSFYIHLGLDGIVRAGIFANSVQRELTASGFVVGQRYKLAFAYKTGESAIYSNGVQKATSTATFVFSSSLDDILLNDSVTYFGYQENVSFNQALLFTSRLSNADLATLTA